MDSTNLFILRTREIETELRFMIGTSTAWLLSLCRYKHRSYFTAFWWMSSRDKLFKKRHIADT